MPDSVANLVLCANQRLVRHLRAEHDRAQVAAGQWSWQPLAALTVGAWLDDVTAGALLAGGIPAGEAPRLVLNVTQERLLWEQAINAHVADGEDPLFDREGLAALAAEANQLCEVWNLKPDAQASEETQRFVAWRRHVRAECEPRGWLDAARHRAWQIRCLANGAGRLPASVAFAGFDRHSPPEMELRRVLVQRGVAVSELSLGREEAGAAVVSPCADRRAECRAAAAWASERLAAQPDARLGIVAIELSGVREMLVAALDDALHPESLLPANAEAPRRYNVSLGTQLARQPVVAVALELLHLCANPRRCEQARLSALLTGPYWSAWQGEAEGRARLDAAMRRHLPPALGVPQALTFARRFEKKGLRIARTRGAIEALVNAIDGNSGRRLPSAWAGVFAQLLDDAGWPGERPLSSREWQAREALMATLDELGALDAVLGKVPLAEANRQLARLCRERVFQPETVGTPSVEVVGPLEAAGLAFDALWVLGMNDDAWPPAPRPNPLLPADSQRRAQATNASSEVQLEFARSVQRRLMHAAPEIVFSWAKGEGDKQLRASPLLAGLPERAPPAALPSVIARMVGTGRIERIEDHRAPPLAEGEHVAGGTRLLQAQALCPAWAFYQFRLGARPLDEPVEGLDAMDRGTLLHRVMERFFSGRTQAQLAAMSAEEGTRAIDDAVASAFADFDGEREERLPPRFAALEQARLAQLLAQWLPLELARPVPFAVAASEENEKVEIEGLALDLRADRVDELADGRRLVVDYKTGDPKTRGWDDERLAEPQLPLYATQCGASGVMFARVRTDDCGFVGWAEEKDLVDGVKAVDWPATLERWRAALATVAREVRAGHAEVTFKREEDLKFCDVRPLLRLPEAKMQQEGQ
ncbi:MAG TPA: PD-(D/E)XK nuclease family protein [Rhodocyclaceae bacterium]|nr:PD-(D/E)XK nuclease family protein [Rhodocyclaceae bacterium]